MANTMGSNGGLYTEIIMTSNGDLYYSIIMDWIWGQGLNITI
jgi:hypothetical protein